MAAAAAAVLGIRSAAAQDAAGLTFDVRVTTGDSATGTEQLGRGWLSGKNTRLDLRGGTGMPMPAMPGMGGNDLSIIVQDSGDTSVVTLLVHDEKTFMHPGKMMAQLQEMMASLGEKPKMTFTVSNIIIDSLGAGEIVSGFATKRYKVSADISIAMEMMGESMNEMMHVESEGDYAEELSDFADPLRDTRGVRAMTAGMPWMDSTAAAELQKLERATPRGLALRHVDRVTGVTGVTEGDMAIPPTTTTLSNIKRETVFPSVFAIPEGYTEMQMPALPAMN
ncbi:MAG: hypothetical protein ACSLFE_12165 [Gemmatimonadaceae bacterium]